MNQQVQNNTIVDERMTDVAKYEPGMGAYNFGDLAQAVKFADVMCAAGPMLPKFMQGNAPICLAVTMRATHWGFDPFALAASAYQAKPDGPVGYEAKVFAAALLNVDGIRLKVRFEGEIARSGNPALSAKGNQTAPKEAHGSRRAVVYAEVDGEVLEYSTPTLDEISIKNSPLWHNDPDLQLTYYGQRNWVRMYRAGVMMGAYSHDEVEDMTPMRDVTPKPGGGLSARLNAMRTEPTKDEDKPIEAEPADEPAEEAEEIDGLSGVPTDEYAEGMQAHMDGKKRGQCPYAPGDKQHEDWVAGWDHRAGLNSADGEQE